MKTITAFVVLLVFLTPGFKPELSFAATIYIQFSGNDATGNVSGSGFSGASWLLEFDIDDTATDSDASAAFGVFTSAIVGGRIVIDGTLYELGGSSSTGTLSLTDASKLGSDGDHIFVNPTSGGFLQFITGDDAIYPAAFTDNNLLTSAILGTSVTNSTTDSFNNSSIISFQFLDPLLFSPGGSIEIVEVSGAASGNITFTVSETSAVPEPSTLALAGFGLVGLLAIGWRRRKRA